MKKLWVYFKLLPAECNSTNKPILISKCLECYLCIANTWNKFIVLQKHTFIFYFSILFLPIYFHTHKHRSKQQHRNNVSTDPPKNSTIVIGLVVWLFEITSLFHRKKTSPPKHWIYIYNIHKTKAFECQCVVHYKLI